MASTDVLEHVGQDVPNGNDNASVTHPGDDNASVTHPGNDWDMQTYPDIYDQFSDDNLINCERELPVVSYAARTANGLARYW